LRYLILPEWLYIIILLGSLILTLIAVIICLRGIVKMCEKQYLLKWMLILLVAVIIHYFSRTGVIIANTMLGG